MGCCSIDGNAATSDHPTLYFDDEIRSWGVGFVGEKATEVFNLVGRNVLWMIGLAYFDTCLEILRGNGANTWG
jgi:hypothetical protein|tara:strand:- start:42 stop:260 length:219 start_codon:yes stop_codon:yes gene_type:complete